MKKTLSLLLVALGILLSGCAQNPSGPDINSFCDKNNPDANCGSIHYPNNPGNNPTVQLNCVICTNKAENPPFCDECHRLLEFDGKKCVFKECENAAINAPQCDECPAGTNWITEIYTYYAQSPALDRKFSEDKAKLLKENEINEENLKFIQGPVSNSPRSYYGKCIEGPNNCGNGAINPPYCNYCPNGQFHDPSLGKCITLQECIADRDNAENAERNCSAYIEFNSKFVPLIEEVLPLKSKKTEYLISAKDGKYYKEEDFPKKDGYPAEGCSLEALHVPICIAEMPTSITNMWPKAMKDRMRPELVKTIAPLGIYMLPADVADEQLKKNQKCMQELQDRIKQMASN